MNELHEINETVQKRTFTLSIEKVHIILNIRISTEISGNLKNNQIIIRLEKHS